MANYRGPNYGHELPEYPNVTFEAKEIRHYVLQMDSTGTSPYQLDYKLKPVTVPPNTDPTDIEGYVTTTGISRGGTAGFLATPWDIPVKSKQCYVVLDLDPQWANWHFVGPGMMSKDKNKAKEFGLRWVVETSNSPWTGEVHDGPIYVDNCKRIYFAVAKRRAKQVGRHVNFFTGFAQADGTFMPVIYDPDVPNLGQKFP
jgi:hypothetical protein